MIIKRGYGFHLYPYGKDKDKFQIRFGVSYRGEKIQMSTGVILYTRKAWNQNTHSVLPKYEGPDGLTGSEINTELEKFPYNMDMVFKKYEILDEYPTVEDVKRDFELRRQGFSPTHVEKKEEKPPKKTVWEVFDLFTKECGEKNAWTESTFEKMASLRVDLKTFRPKLEFEDLTEKTLTDFVVYLRDKKKLNTPRKPLGERQEYEDSDLMGIMNSTIGKKLGFLKWFLNWATDAGYNTKMDYRKFDPTLKSTQHKIIYLTHEELERLSNLDLTSNLNLEPVRDIFLFSCYSGLRFSDTQNLKRSDIHDGAIHVTTIKTADSIVIELNDVTTAILAKYYNAGFKNNCALPQITNQAMNRDLKILCRLAEINELVRYTYYKGNERIDEMYEKWEKVGSHVGRRTFIVNALSMGIAPSIVMKWTGHSSYNAMKPYIDIVDSIRASSMQKFNAFSQGVNVTGANS